MMILLRSKLPLFLLSLGVFSLPALDATFTIGAVDTATMQLGAAGSSCIRGASIYGATYAVPLPSRALMIAQAVINDRDHVFQKGEELLAQDTAPEDVVTAITDPSFDDEGFVGFLTTRCASTAYLICRDGPPDTPARLWRCSTEVTS